MKSVTEMKCYLDNSATTCVCKEAAEAAYSAMMDNYGNPSSLHAMGFSAERTVRDAGVKLASYLKCDPKEIIFTSGGTESDNLAIIGGAMASRRRGNHLITTKIEHPAVLMAFKHLEEEGFEVTYLGTDERGIISLEELESSLREDTVLVSIMHVNNEIGSVQPIERAAEIIKTKNPQCLFHVDDVQGFTKLRLNPGQMKIDLMSVSGHKIHAPKGVGLLYVRNKVRLIPQTLGGGQQEGLRSGTENVPGIAAVSAAVQMMYKNMPDTVAGLYQKRRAFIEAISDIDDVWINGPGGFDHYGEAADEAAEFAPHIISLSVKDVRAEVLLHALEDKGIYVSAGSACSSHKRTPSATLMSISLKKELLESTIRISMSEYTTDAEMEYTADTLRELIPALRRFVRK